MALNSSGSRGGHEVVRLPYDDLVRDVGYAAQLGGDPEEFLHLGCFVLANCLPVAEVERVHVSLQRLFDARGEEKERCRVDKKREPLGHGYSPYGVARALDTGIPNLLETWDLSPTGKAWPSHLRAEWEVLIAYQHALSNIGQNVLRLISTTLRLPSDTLGALVEKNSGIHLIHYFKLDTTFPPGSVRQSKHCDNTLVTIIPPYFPEDDGVAIFDNLSNRWLDVRLGKTDCLVQAGLVLEYISGGTIRANLHTVTTPALGSPLNRARYSTPFFISPSPGTVVRRLTGIAPDVEGQGAGISIDTLQADYFRKIFGE